MKDAPGTYVLVLIASEAQPIDVGALGEMEMVPGAYLYVGSAHGPGGVRARVERHRRSSAQKSLHWHVDYLRAATDWREAWVAYGEDDRECTWAGAVGDLDGAHAALDGFGASDCNCRSHCFRVPKVPSLDAFRRRLGAAGGRPDAPKRAARA